MHKLTNDYLQISVKETGAELCSLLRRSDGTQYMWQADPNVWAGHAPILFPIIGALKEDSYFYRGKRYMLPHHGFVRHSTRIRLFRTSGDNLTFRLLSGPETLEHYPFHFELFISYTLRKNSLFVDHRVCNTGREPLFFSLGGHPAFRCPLNSDEKYSDYYLEFEMEEIAHTYQIETSGLIGEKTDRILDKNNAIVLHDQLFSKGALVFKNLHSRRVDLISRHSGKRLRVEYPGFPYLGIWAKPAADFVCIEPWLGIADPVDTDQQLEVKEGILRLV